MGFLSLRVFSALGIAATLGGCNSTGYATCDRVECYSSHAWAEGPRRTDFANAPFDDPAADYTRRALTISPGAGNAQAANLALQTATPWPRHSQNTNITGNGAQMVRAVNEFERGTRETLSTKRTFEGNGGASAAQPNDNGPDPNSR